MSRETKFVQMTIEAASRDPHNVVSAGRDSVAWEGPLVEYLGIVRQMITSKPKHPGAWVVDLDPVAALSLVVEFARPV
jgi:hypothetical protein